MNKRWSFISIPPVYHQRNLLNYSTTTYVQSEILLRCAHSLTFTGGLIALKNASLCSLDPCVSFSVRKMISSLPSSNWAITWSAKGSSLVASFFIFFGRKSVSTIGGISSTTPTLVFFSWWRRLKEKECKPAD